MNSEWSDKVFDSLAEEVVTGQHPPDLTARIADAWQRERAGNLPLPQANEANRVLVAPPISVTPSRTSTAVQSEKSSQRPYFPVALLFAAAASVLLAVGGLQLRQWMTTGNESSDQALASDQDLTPPVKDASPTPKAEKQLAASGETLPLESVPFASQDSSVTNNPQRRERYSATDETRLSDQEIVGLIDSQLSGLWKQLNLVPAPRVSDEELAQTLSRALTGQELPSAEAAELAGLQPAARRDKVISTAIDSNAFAHRWSEKLVHHWLRGGTLAFNSDPVEKLEQFVAGGIANGRPWNEVVTQVVAGGGEAGDAFVLALSGGENHRFASNISSQLMDSSLACARCHTSIDIGGDVQSQEDYWSLVALLQGVEVRSTPEQATRNVVDKQPTLFADSKSPSLFFERPDGTLQAAKFVLPDGQPWQSVEGSVTPRLALSHWLGQSLQADRATVDQVWQVAFGRPLVGSNPLMNDVGLAERDDLLQLLALQFRAHGRDFSQLVGWVLRADAFARSEIALDQNRWLQATEGEFGQWHSAEVSFAAKTSLGKFAAGSSLEGSLAAALKWNQSSGVDTRVLAQPNPDPKAQPNALVKSDVVMPAAGYAIHRGRVSVSQAQFLDRLHQSEKLSWKQKVEHVVSLSPGLAANGHVMQLADTLKDELKDQRKALIELFWAVQNADAS